MIKPTFDEEKILWQKGFKYIAGIDEVGRGCFAGPVVAAAVILSPDFNATDEINDSKLLSPKKREELSVIIRKHAVSFGIAEISVREINKKGIGKATQMAFRKALSILTLRPDFVLIDAFYVEHLTRKYQKPIIKGDRKSITIAAASIIAKVYRDERMELLHKRYPEYSFVKNKGYGTKDHQAAIKKYGLSEIHRTSFNLTKFI